MGMMDELKRIKEKLKVFGESSKFKIGAFGAKSRYVIDELSLDYFGMTTGEIIENLKSGIRGKFNSQQFVGTVTYLSEYFTKLLAFLFITVFAFYPEIIMGFFWIFLAIIIATIIITIILIIFFPQAYAAVVIRGMKYFGGTPASLVFKSAGTIFLLLLVTILLPSPNYYKVFGLRIGTFPVYVMFIFAFLISFVLAASKFPKILIFGIVYLAFLYFLIPLVIFATATKACVDNVSLLGLKIPLISDFLEQRSCKRLTASSLIMTGKEYPVISSSGLTVKIGLNEMLPLPAGQKHKEVIFITNNYQGQISLLNIKPYIKSNYYDVVFIPTDYKQKKSTLLRDETYGEELVFDPYSMKIDSRKKCLWTTQMINQSGYPVECAYDVSCISKNNIESFCVEYGKLQCKCVDWIDATCSGEPLNIILSITHTGSLVGKGILYYFEDYTPQSLPYYKYSQYPADAVFNFIPNPWFQKRYTGYIEEVQMFAQIKIYGSNPQLTYLEVEPRDTVVNITNEYEGIWIRETIGIKKKSCISLSEINEALKSAGSWSGILCTFTPPSVHVEIVNLTSGEEILNSSISIGLINQYCNAQYINISSYPNINQTLLEKYWEYVRKASLLSEDVRKTINDYGLCSYLKKAKSEEEQKKKQMIEENLKKVEVSVRFDYVTTETFTSRKIYPYYTSSCSKKPAEKPSEQPEITSPGSSSPPEEIIPPSQSMP
jgi:hypothetical protein